MRVAWPRSPRTGQLIHVPRCPRSHSTRLALRGSHPRHQRWCQDQMLPHDAATRAEPCHQDHVRILTRGQGSSREGRHRLIYALLTSSPLTNAVRHYSTNGYHVPREWWEYGTSDTACKGFLRKDALQCNDGLLSRVSLPFECVTSVSQRTRYGLSEGSPSEEGTHSIPVCDWVLTSSATFQAFGLMLKLSWTISSITRFTPKHRS